VDLIKFGTTPDIPVLPSSKNITRYLAIGIDRNTFMRDPNGPRIINSEF